jgi:hypothetical protein
VLDNGQSYKDLKPVDQAYIDAVNKYMQQRGYVLVSKENNPDIGIDVNRIYNTTTGYYSYDDYWDYYGGYWDPIIGVMEDMVIIYQQAMAFTR